MFTDGWEALTKDEENIEKTRKQNTITDIVIYTKV